MSGKRTNPAAIGVLPARLMTLLAAALWLVGFIAAAPAASLDREAMKIFFPKPLMVGERDATLPVWPIFKQSYNGDEMIAYAFESMDFEPIPGFSGTPVNLLITVKPSGEFLDVRVLTQHEPVFVDGLGPEPLTDFVKQYAGKSLRQSIKIVAPGTRDPRADSVAAEINGVAKATASVRIINETIINSALQVARERLGFSKGRDPNRAAHAKADVFEPLTFAQMLDRGYIRHLRLSNAAVEKAFAGTVGEGVDEAALADPKGAFADVYIAEVDVPIIGRNLLGEAHWRKLMGQLDGAPAMLVLSNGRWTFMPDNFVLGSTPDFIALNQAEAPVAWRDFVWRDKLDLPVPEGLDLATSDVAILRIAPQAAFDPASPSEFSMRVIREKGQIFPEKAARDFTLAYALPKELFDLPPSDDGTGLASIWMSRVKDISILGRRTACSRRGIGAAEDADPVRAALKALQARLSRFHAGVHRLDRAGASVDCLAVRSRQGDQGRGEFCLFPVGSADPHGRGFRVGGAVHLGARDFLWLALSLRGLAGIRRRDRPRVAPAPDWLAAAL